VLQEDLRSLGVVVPPAEVDEGVFGSGTQAAVREVQALAGLEPTGVFDLDAQLALARLQAAAAFVTPRVEGRLRTDLAAPAAGATLRLYRYGADGETVSVGEATTDPDGYFRVDYDATPDPAAAIELRVVTQNGEEIAISQPKPAARHEALNLVAPATAVPAAPELERLSVDVERTLGGFAPLVRAVNEPADADRPGGNDPLVAAHRATGWDARVLAMAGAAAGLAGSTGLDPRGTYALVRHGLPTNVDELAAVRPGTVRATLAQAVQAGLVQMNQGEIRTFAREFAAFADRTRLASRPAGALSAYGEFLDNSGLGGNQREAYDAAVVDHADDPVKLWDAVRAADVDEPGIAKLQAQGKLALLTTQNQPLTAKLTTELLAGGDRPDLRSLVSADLHDPAAWRTRLTELAGGDDDRLGAVIPPGFRDGLEVTEAADLYASELARRVRMGFPTAVVGRLVGTGKVELGDDHAHLATPVAGMIEKAETLGFSFTSTPLGPFLLDHAGELTAGLDKPTAEAAVGQLQRLQRLYQITPSNDALAVLAKAGVRSALDVAVLEKGAFVERFGRAFQRPDELELVFRRSQQVAAVTYSFFGISKDAGAAGTSVTSLPAAQRAEAVEALIKKFPTVEELFGEQDFCACTHCRSVLGPAAYLVDLLHFLDPAGATGPTPFATLTKRRPDLEHLPLTCENTNTALPLLDVANEIMEYRVANDRLDAGAVRDTGPMVTADLLAEPQYLLPAAYDRLRGARYPLTLPFDLWRATIHGFLARAEVDPADLLDAFRRTDELLLAPTPPPPPGQPPPLPRPEDLWYRRSAVFLSQLGLSTAEAAILTDPETDGWFRLYGYATAEEARGALRSAKTLARRLGVSYVELVELVKTWFVNPDLDAVAALRSLGLEVLDVLRFQGAVGVAPLTELERAAVTAKLDAATKAFGRDDFDAAAWLDDAWQANRFDDVLLLADDDPGCSFEHTTLRFAGTEPPADPTTDPSLDTVLLRLNLLVRLWRRLGWRLPELDLALSALLPGGRDGLTGPGLGERLRTALLYLAHLRELAGRLGSRVRHRLDLVMLWGPMPTRGPESTYARLFLSPRSGVPDPVFDHPTGAYLSGGGTLADHQTAVQAALSMSAVEIAAVCAAAGTTPGSAPLTLETVSLLYRHALLARALNLAVVELLALRELAGVDPMHALHADPPPGPTLPLPTGPGGVAADYPLSGTLEFLDLLEDLRAAGLSVSECDYLLRHRFDAVGPLRSDEAAVHRLAVQLADGVRSLEERHAPPQRRRPPEDPATISDEDVVAVLGLVLPADTATRVASMWQRQVGYTAAKQGVAEADRIAADTLTRFPELTVDYEANLQVQRLTYRGFPVLERTEAIKTANPSPVLAELLDLAASDADRERRATFAWLVGDDDVTPLFRPPPDISALGPAEAVQALQGYERSRRTRFAERVMPRVLGSLRRRFVVDTVRNSLGAQAADVAPELLEALLTDADLLTPPGGARPLVEVLADVDARGLTATARDEQGAPLATGAVAEDTTTAGIDGAADVVLDGYLQVPTTGRYRFRLTVGAAGDSAEARIGNAPDPVLGLTAATDGEFREVVLDLRADGLHRLTLRATGAAVAAGHDVLGGVVALTVAAETLTLGPLRRLTLRPAVAVQRFASSYLLYRKAVMLLGRLGLSERECRHFRRYAADFGGFDLAALPTAPLPAAAAAPQFAALRRLTAYLRLRADMAGGTPDLIDVFELSRGQPTAGGSMLDAVCARVASLTRRDPPTVATLASHLGLTASADAAGRGLADERGLRRLWAALELTGRLGVSAAAAIAAATPDPDAAVARGLRDAVRARYDLDAWRSLAGAVNDPLRRRRRDGLVAYLLHELQLERVEQLYEQLLLDPATEPVVQTTRMRLAISSVQLFIQRCLLNLEEEVPAAAIDSDRWAWMKRYRVWEANRKIFLFPENWLAPELRDDQTHLFTALVGAFMEADVTDELVEDAFVAYLRGLAEIARLEIVSVWAEPDRRDPKDNRLHVIGRDHNSPRNHYYRRFAHHRWTPWEPVGAQIEGDEVVAVVYRGRLHLFWVTLLVKAVDPATGEKTIRDLAEEKPDALKRFDLQAQLHWTELVSGQWTPRASSDLLTIAESQQQQPPRYGRAYAVRNMDTAGRETAVTIRLRYWFWRNDPKLGWSGWEPTLRFVSRQGRPFVELQPWADAPSSVSREFGPPEHVNGPLWLNTYPLTDGTVLGEWRPASVVQAPAPAPVDTPIVSQLVNPFFYADRPDISSGGIVKTFTGQNTFFVQPRLTAATWVEYEGSFVPAVTKTKHTVESVQTLEVEATAPASVRTLATGQTFVLPSEPVDETATIALRKPADWATSGDAPILVGRRLVGPGGDPPVPGAATTDPFFLRTR
jgi:hypothetical protein